MHTRSNLTRQVLFLYIPSNWNFQILDSAAALNVPTFHLLYLYNNTYFFKLPLVQQASSFAFDKQASTLSYNVLYTPTFYKLYLTTITNILHSFSKIFFTKLKFKGKGYYIYKNVRNTITPQFGHAHRIYLYSFYLSVKFLTKTTVFVFGSSKKDILTISQSIHTAKPLNVFTGRGVRFSRQVIYKKTGKVSSYR